MDLAPLLTRDAPRWLQRAMLQVAHRNSERVYASAANAPPSTSAAMPSTVDAPAIVAQAYLEATFDETINLLAYAEAAGGYMAFPDFVALLSPLPTRRAAQICRWIASPSSYVDVGYVDAKPSLGLLPRFQRFTYLQHTRIEVPHVRTFSITLARDFKVGHTSVTEVDAPVYFGLVVCAIDATTTKVSVAGCVPPAYGRAFDAAALAFLAKLQQRVNQMRFEVFVSRLPPQRVSRPPGCLRQLFCLASWRSSAETDVTMLGCRRCSSSPASRSRIATYGKVACPPCIRLALARPFVAARPMASVAAKADASVEV
ncbi:hypothetical protein SPRG_02823 [Saprolegnia parasitica CBS 223.65]|uniref:Uncharacterized protein n=1 Tax=Saprolegnia parasitica (strain CBS 223.65) TaxID=695850 RepID=A0A067CSX1_SAPPC|nr:hypothetical protein SPRG_02823 [Saprolegnia parasitica CBS 223.65]KDO32345.1 hypothetical protein SPRG_02823 [Saprolegnia parasitica CBS 223.65]|eukprot:XP_012196800.1 hypothetical protein SPRG_02823 [Saprolegnia parasitica CBS 223.65]